jgi:hypothetical protein
MPSSWRRVSPAIQTGLIQAVLRKSGKTITIFNRSSSAPGAGSPAQKAKFSKCAATTRGIRDRRQRNDKMRDCLGST